jgi:two-component system OmpR family response regulator
MRRKEYQILEYLVRHAGQTIDREKLIEQVWHGEDTSFNAVDAQIKTLRAKLDKPFHHHCIVTVHGQGYKFCPTPCAETPQPSPLFNVAAFSENIVQEHSR